MGGGIDNEERTKEDVNLVHIPDLRFTSNDPLLWELTGTGVCGFLAMINFR